MAGQARGKRFQLREIVQTITSRFKTHAEIQPPVEGPFHDPAGSDGRTRRGVPRRRRHTRVDIPRGRPRSRHARRHPFLRRTRHLRNSRRVPLHVSSRRTVVPSLARFRAEDYRILPSLIQKSRGAVKTHRRAANPGRSRLLGGQSRLKAGCGQNCPPSNRLSSSPIGCLSPPPDRSRWEVVFALAFIL
jgi:hypothetical protein